MSFPICAFCLQSNKELNLFSEHTEVNNVLNFHFLYCSRWASTLQFKVQFTFAFLCFTLCANVASSKLAVWQYHTFLHDILVAVGGPVWKCPHRKRSINCVIMHFFHWDKWGLSVSLLIFPGFNLIMPFQMLPFFNAIFLTWKWKKCFMRDNHKISCWQKGIGFNFR